MNRPFTTADMFRGNIPKPTIKLKNIGTITPIGTFQVKGPIVVGDTDYQEVKVKGNGMKKGLYAAYKVGDNLVISHEKSNIDLKKLSSYNWSHSGAGVGVDGGTFGFFDKSIVDKINKLTGRNGNNLPPIEYPSYDYFIVNTNLSDINKPLPKSLQNIDYGVISGTGTGDGVFECYTLGNDNAVLIGGYTMGELEQEGGKPKRYNHNGHYHRSKKALMKCKK